MFFNSQLNAFQAVIATDGDITYILFHYGDIQWVPDTTFIGFSVGDFIRQIYTLPESRDNSSLFRLETTSNTGQPGRFIYRVDQKYITDINEARIKGEGIGMGREGKGREGGE